MDYHGLVKGLLKEAKRGIQFARMSTPVKILLYIGLFPLFVLAFLSVASFYVTLFFYKAFLSPVEYLHKLIKAEGKEAKHATQFAIYWLSWPFIFTLYVLQSLMAITFYFQWFFMMMYVYLATLGGVRWQPMMNDATFDTVETYSVKPGDTGLYVYTGFLAFFDFLMAIAIVVLQSAPIMSFALIGIMVMLFIINPLVFKKEGVLPVEASVAQEEASAE